MMESASVSSTHGGADPTDSRARTPCSIPHTLPTHPSVSAAPVTTCTRREAARAAARATWPVPSEERSSTTTTRIAPG